MVAIYNCETYIFKPYPFPAFGDVERRGELLIVGFIGSGMTLFSIKISASLRFRGVRTPSVLRNALLRGGRKPGTGIPRGKKQKRGNPGGRGIPRENRGGSEVVGEAELGEALGTETEFAEEVEAAAELNACSDRRDLTGEICLVV